MNHWNSGRVYTNTIDIHYWRTGSGTQAVLLAHGLADNGRCWLPIANALADHYDVIMPDARGHGLSSTPDTGYTSADRVADMLGLMDELGLDQVIAIGHSMGAEACALLAATAPERVQAVVLEDPPFRDDDAVNGRLAAASYAAGLAEHQQHTKAALMAKVKAENPGWADETIEPWAEAKLQTRPQVFQWIEHRTNTWRDLAARISVPTLLITAEPARGAIISAKISAVFAQRCPTAEVAFIADAGHCIARDQPAAYLAAIKAFLDRVMGDG